MLHQWFAKLTQRQSKTRQGDHGRYQESRFRRLKIDGLEDRRLLAADLSIEKTATSEVALSGGFIEYNLTVTNNGDTAATFATIQDQLPTGTTFIAGINPGAAFNPITGIISIDTGPIAAGATFNFVLVLQVNANVLTGTLIGNTATVASPFEGNGTLADNTDSAQTTILRPGSITAAPNPFGTGTALVIVGTNDNDHISITRDNRGTKIAFDSPSFSNTRTLRTNYTQLIVLGLGGDDHIAVTSTIRLSTFLSGGDGNDHLATRGNTADVMLGDHGNDHLASTGGRDVMIGGDGSDHLAAGSGDTVLIGGSTAFDTSLVGVAGIVAANNLANQNARAQALESLFTGSVIEDNDRDELSSGNGRDLFFANIAGPGQRDKVRRGSGDRVIDT